MAIESQKNKVSLEDIQRYQNTNSLLFYVAFCLAAVLSIYTFQQVTSYLLPTTRATIVEIESGSYKVKRQICQNLDGSHKRTKCNTVTLDRPKHDLKLEYKIDGEIHRFSETFYENKHFRVGKSMMINFYQGKPNFSIPSTSRVIFIFVVLILGLVTSFRWILHSYQANRIMENQPNMDIKSRFKELRLSNGFALSTGLISFTLCIFVYVFDSNTVLVTITTVSAAMFITLAYVSFVAKFAPDLVKNYWVPLAICMITGMLAMHFTNRTNLPDGTIIQIALVGAYFISLFNVKKLALNN